MARTKREKFIIGVDLGGTNIVVGAMPVDGSREISDAREPDALRARAPRRSSIASSAMLEQAMAETMEQSNATRKDFLGVGIGAPGPLDRERGIVHRRAQPRLERFSAARRDRRARSPRRRRSTTTRTARRSASGGAARRAADATSSA